jgi:hypothetical protein
MSAQAFTVARSATNTVVGYIPRIYNDFDPKEVADCITKHLTREDRRTSIDHIDFVSRHDNYGREYFIAFVHIANLPNRLKRAMTEGNNIEIQVSDSYDTAQRTILIRKYVQRAQPPATSDETITTFVPLTNTTTTRPEVPTFASVVSATTTPPTPAPAPTTTTPTITTTNPITPTTSTTAPTTPATTTTTPTVSVPDAPRPHVRSISRLTATSDVGSQASAEDLLAQTVRDFSTNPDFSNTPTSSPITTTLFPTHSFPVPPSPASETRLSVLEGRALIAEEHIASCERTIHTLTENQNYILKLLHATVEHNQRLDKELRELRQELAALKLEKEAEEFHKEQEEQFPFTEEEQDLMEKAMVEEELKAKVSAFVAMIANNVPSDPSPVPVPV